MCNTILELWEFCKELGLDCVQMKRFNQDLLENLFSQIRGLGFGHTHPGAKGVLERLKHIGLGAKAKSIEGAVVRLEFDLGSMSIAKVSSELLASIKLVED